jgi:hypothetical protein
VQNILEAIAATIYADRAHGLRYGKCKHCGKLFKFESDHDQEFCPAGKRKALNKPTSRSAPLLVKSYCGSAYAQKKRREVEGVLIALFLEGRTKGFSEREIESLWVAKGIDPTPKLREHAKDKARRQAKKATRAGKGKV